MNTVQDALSPKLIATELFTDAVAAVARMQEIYERNTEFLRGHFEAYARASHSVARVRATYPFVRITTTTHARLDSRFSYGFVAGPGAHETTVTRPDLFRAYLTEQIGLLIENHRVAVEIGELDEPDPDPLRLSARHQHRGLDAQPDAVGPTAPRCLRHARSRGNGRRDRQWHAARAARCAGAACLVPRGSHRLFAAPALPLHRHRSRALPEFRDLYQLPVLRRCLRADLPRAHGERAIRTGGVCRARKRHYAQCAARRRRSDGVPRRSACRRCQPFISSRRTVAASP